MWLTLAALLAIGYSYRFELTDLVNRLGGEIIPYAAVTSEDGSVRVRAHSDGHFYVDSRIGGQEIRFLVDTGATSVALSPADAARIGLDLARLDFSRRLQTAGGVVRGAPVVIRSLEIGGIRLTNVRAIVNEQAMPHSLLGISALDRLGGYEGANLFGALRRSIRRFGAGAVGAVRRGIWRSGSIRRSPRRGTDGVRWLARPG